MFYWENWQHLYLEWIALHCSCQMWTFIFRKMANWENLLITFGSNSVQYFITSFNSGIFCPCVFQKILNITCYFCLPGFLFLRLGSERIIFLWVSHAVTSWLRSAWFIFNDTYLCLSSFAANWCYMQYVAFSCNNHHFSFSILSFSFEIFQNGVFCFLFSKTKSFIYIEAFACIA